MVHRRDHGNDRLAVGKGQDADLGARQEFLNDDVVAAFAEHLIFHHGTNGVLGFFARHRDDNALAEC